MNKKIVLGLFALLLLSLVPAGASARTVPGTLGNPYFASASTCFTTSLGIENSCTTSQYWQIPVLWDTGTGAAKTLRLSGWVGSGGSLACAYDGYNASGTVTVVTAFPAFTANFSPSTITVTSVPGGTFGYIYCLMSGNSTSEVLGLDYNLP